MLILNYDERMGKIFLARERSLKIESGEIEGNFEDTNTIKCLSVLMGI